MELDKDTEEKTEFKFDELDESAKNKARDKWREGGIQYDWWDCTYENATTVGDLIGIEIGTTTVQLHSGKTRQYPDISFSGFCSQGDGCCYSGTLNIAKLKGCVAAVKTHVGEDETMFALAARGEALYDQIALRLFTLRPQGVDINDPDYTDFEEVLLTTSTAIHGKERSCYTTSVDLDNAPEEIEDAMNEYVSDFADWIYKQLEAESDWLNSDEYVDEDIKNNDCIFDEFGSAL